MRFGAKILPPNALKRLIESSEWCLETNFNNWKFRMEVLLFSFVLTKKTALVPPTAPPPPYNLDQYNSFTSSGLKMNGTALSPKIENFLSLTN
jgi:hypothetical protein